jgi:uncharacterized protein (DUF2235 family)
MADARNIVIAFDGTGNKPELNDEGVSHKSSNVYKFHRALMNKKSEPTVKIYRQGVGTQYGEEVTGNAFGIGLLDKITSAYRKLQQYLTDERFEKNRIFVIGFSRGAYAARRFCHLLAFSGTPLDLEDWKSGWENFTEQDEAAAKDLKETGRFFDVEIEMLGVWDTVKAAPTISDIKDDILPANVKKAYHAISIDERREIFDVLRFKPNRKVREVWFSGVHSDIGGGYLEHGLSDITLDWMIAHAYNQGLTFKKSALMDMNPSVDPEGEPHDESTKGIWRTLGHIHRKVNDSDPIHYTVKERIANAADYNPVNLPANPVYVDEELV